MSTATPTVRKRARALAATLRNLDRDVKTVAGLWAASAAFLVLVLAVVPLFYTAPVLVCVGVGIYTWLRYQEAAAQLVMFVMTVSTVLVLALITAYLVTRSVPAFRVAGLEILTDVGQSAWNPSANEFSLVTMIWATFLTTTIAMFVAAPLGVAGALFISEIAPSWARELLKPAVEMLAGIPSIVYGFLGYQLVLDYMYTELNLPVYGSIFAVGVVIGVMALPTVVSVAEDAIAAVPDAIKDGSAALGATSWQTITDVTLPASFSGVSAAVLLGVGRAVGETMAATVMLTHSGGLPDPLYDVFGPLGQETLTSLIASQYGVAEGKHLSALFAAGVVLFVTVMTISVASQYIESRMQEKLGGEL
ncbi:MAG: phosphate ABC transporter permease subunit PstC [Halobacterium sp.]